MWRCASHRTPKCPYLTRPRCVSSATELFPRYRASAVNVYLSRPAVIDRRDRSSMPVVRFGVLWRVYRINILSRRARSCVDSHSYSVSFDIVITALSRCIVLIVAASIFAVTLPTRAEVPKPPRHRMDCCAHMAGEHGHCGANEPVGTQDRQCCAACNLCFSLIAASNYPFFFSPDRGEKLFGEIAASSSRSDRPPVPPPRV